MSRHCTLLMGEMRFAYYKRWCGVALCFVVLSGHGSSEAGRVRAIEDWLPTVLHASARRACPPTRAETSRSRARRSLLVAVLGLGNASCSSLPILGQAPAVHPEIPPLELISVSQPDSSRAGQAIRPPRTTEADSVGSPRDLLAMLEVLRLGPETAGLERSSKVRLGSSYTVSFTLAGKRHKVTRRRLCYAEDYEEQGKISHYGRGDTFGGKLMANGEKMDPDDPELCAHPTLPIGQRILVTVGLKRAYCIVKDRGPFVGSRIADMSHALGKKLGMLKKGLVRATIRTVAPFVDRCKQKVAEKKSRRDRG